MCRSNSGTGTITNCYSTGNVSEVGYNVGGFVGNNTDGAITNSHSTSSVNGGASNIGGLICFNGEVVINSFWDSETSGQPSSSGGTGKTTIEMKTESTLTNTWTINNNINNGYPFLQGVLIKYHLGGGKAYSMMVIHT